MLDKPHNPLMNSGAIVVASLLKNELSAADRFDYVSISVHILEQFQQTNNEFIIFIIP